MNTVMIILGAPRSGSTLLSKAIGGHSKCFAIGEINRFDFEINDAKTHCGCANKLSDCYFWNDILISLNTETTLEIKDENSGFKVGIFKQLVRINKIHHLILTILFGKKYNNKTVNKQIDNTFKLYRTIFNKTKSKVIIDSSKGLFRALVLASRNKGDTQFKFIQLTRDGRGVLNSILKPTYDIIHKDGVIKKYRGMTNKTSSEIINSWLYVNLRNYIILKLLNNKKSVFIRYEDFTLNPSVYLKQIYNEVALTYENSALDLGVNENHMLGGNTSRINAKRIKKQDDAWRTNLDDNLLKKFNKRAGWFNKLIGYK